LTPRDEAGRILGLHSLFPDMRGLPVRNSHSSGRSRGAVTALLNTLPSNGNSLERLLAYETRTSLPDNLLLLGDKLSMASGLEVRVPLLDPSYLKLVETVPGELRRGGSFAGTGKLLHKKV